MLPQKPFQAREKAKPIDRDVLCPYRPLTNFDQPFGGLQGFYGCKRAISGHFRPLWRPMAPHKGLSGPGKRPKHIATDVPWPDQTLIKFDQPVWSLQGDLWFKRSFFCHFRPHWRLMAPPRGLSGPRKRSKHIAPDVPWPDQTLIIFDQPVWSLQGDFCLQKVFLIIFCHFWPL